MVKIFVSNRPLSPATHLETWPQRGLQLSPRYEIPRSIPVHHFDRPQLIYYRPLGGHASIHYSDEGTRGLVIGLPICSKVPKASHHVVLKYPRLVGHYEVNNHDDVVDSRNNAILYVLPTINKNMGLLSLPTISISFGRNGDRR